MSKEMQQALNKICQSVENREVMTQALTIASEVIQATRNTNDGQTDECDSNKEGG